VASGYGDSSQYNQVWFNDFDGYTESDPKFWNRVIEWLFYSLPLAFINSLPRFSVDVLDLKGQYVAPGWGHRDVAFVVVFAACPDSEDKPEIVVVNGRASVLRKFKERMRYEHHS